MQTAIRLFIFIFFFFSNVKIYDFNIGETLLILQFHQVRQKVRNVMF